MHKVQLGLTVKLNVPYDEAIRRATTALKDEGFGILTEIDVKETLRQKLNVDFQRYVILGACNPPLAYRALQTDPDIGLLLPCNVIVYEEGTGSGVSIIDPLSMVGFLGNPALQPIAAEARARLDRVVKKLSAG